MKKLLLILTLIVVFTIGTFNIASAKQSKVNPGQAKKQQVTTKAKVAPGQSKKTVTKKLPTVIKIGRFQLPVNPIVKDLGAKVEILSATEIKITKDTSVVIMIKITPDIKKSTVVEINSTVSGVAAYKKFTQKGNGVINPTSYIKSLLKVVPPTTPTPPATPVSAIGASIADKLGEGNNGLGIITFTTTPAINNKYVCSPIQEGTIAVALGSTITNWNQVVSGDTIGINSAAAVVNGKHIGIAEINASNLVVNFVDITIGGIADYTAATAGKSVGSVRITNDKFLTALTVIQNSNTLIFTVDKIDKTYVISDAITTKDAFIAALNASLGGSATASFDVTNHYLQVVSNTTGTASTVDVSGSAKAAFFDTALVTVGTAAAN